MEELDGLGPIWPLCSLQCLVKDDVLLIIILLHSKWEIFTSRRPIPMCSLEPHLSCSHISGYARFMATCIITALPFYCSPRHVPLPRKHLTLYLCRFLPYCHHERHHTSEHPEHLTTPWAFIWVLRCTTRRLSFGSLALLV
jgi:hypothetical protein